MSKKNKTLFNKICDYLGFLGMGFITLLSKILPIELTSFLFGNLAILLCPFIPTTYLVLKNLKYTMPEKNFMNRLFIMFKVWYNLGSLIGEYLYIFKMKKNKIFKYVHINEETKNIIDEIKQNKTGSLIFSGHISNWEMGLRALTDNDVKLDAVFRLPNNPLIGRKYTSDLRESLGIKMITKEDNAAFKIIKALKRGENVIILVDQRDSSTSGILLNFFGKKALTNKTLYIIAKRMNIPIYGTRVIRNKGLVNFELVLEKKQIINDDTNEATFTQNINDILERWIREYPEQWFWVHNRWKGNGEFEKFK